MLRPLMYADRGPGDNRVALLLVAILIVTAYSAGQKLNKVEQQQAREILRRVQEAIEKRYYDPARTSKSAIRHRFLADLPLWHGLSRD